MNETYSVQEISNMLNVSEEQVRRWIREGKLIATIRSKKEGYRIDRSELSKFMLNNPKYCIDGFIEKPEYYDPTLIEFLNAKSYFLKQHILGLIQECLELTEFIKTMRNEGLA